MILSIEIWKLQILETFNNIIEYQIIQIIQVDKISPS